MADMPIAPRRRVTLDLRIGADSWDDLKIALRSLETDIAMHGSLSSNCVSGGYSSGWWFTADEDESITHDSWAEANDRYCAALASQRENGEQGEGQPR